MEMYLRQSNPSAAMAVLKDALKYDPPSLPPMGVLNHLCQALDPQDLSLVIDSLLQNGTTVSQRSTLISSRRSESKTINSLY